jgi:hypothetical protein
MELRVDADAQRIFSSRDGGSTVTFAMGNTANITLRPQRLAIGPAGQRNRRHAELLQGTPSTGSRGGEFADSGLDSAAQRRFFSK